MDRSKTVKYFNGKVAVVHGMTSPIATCISLKLIEHGARLILMEEEQSQSAFELSREINLLWGGGVDSNYEGGGGGDSWGVKTKAKHLNVLKRGLLKEEVKNLSLTAFGKLPELLIDVNKALSPSELECFASGEVQDQKLCIQPLTSASLWTPGWLATIPDENWDPAEASHEEIAVFITCNWSLIQNLIKAELSEIQRGNQRDIWLLKTDNLFRILAYFLHGGVYIKASDFRTQLRVNGQLKSPGIPQDSSDCSRVELEKIKVDQLMTLDQDQAKTKLPEQESEDLLKDIPEGVVASGSEDWIDDSGPTQQDDDDSYLTRDSDLLKNRTFDALLQKTKDYPVDWWEGGCEKSVSVDDINCKVLAKAAANFAVRWVVLGYLVIGLAVPKVLGWTGL